MTVTTDMAALASGQPSISILEIPAGDDNPFFRALQRLGDAQGSRFEVGDAHGSLMRSEIQLSTSRMRAWNLFLQAEKEDVLIRVVVPEDDHDITSESIESALHTITFRDGDAERMSALPFTIGNLEGFRPVTLGFPAIAFLKGGSLELTQGPKPPNSLSYQPILIVTPNPRAVIPADRQLDYATAVLHSVHDHGDLQAVAERQFTADGDQWAEIKAKGESSIPANALILVRFGSSQAGVISFYCTSPASDPVDYSDRFRGLALSTKLKGPQTR